jgi:hypothetical protein
MELWLWPESTSELDPLSDRSLLEKLVPNFADIECHVVSGDGSLRPYSLLSRPEPLRFLPSGSSVVLTRLSGPRSRLTTFFSGNAGNRTRASGSVAKNSDH